MEPKNPIAAILEALASQEQWGETSLIVKLELGLIEEAMNALRSYRKLFAPVVPGLTDTTPIYAAYEQLREAHEAQHTILLFVECHTIQEFREALGRMPIRKSSEWRDFFSEGSVSPY